MRTTGTRRKKIAKIKYPLEGVDKTFIPITRDHRLQKKRVDDNI
jgi:hypothetical protein